MACGYAFHAHAIDDPRGRDAGRASYIAAVRTAGMHTDVVIEQTLRAPRANRVFGTDKKRIRTKNTVMNKSNGALGWLFLKIVDGVRICFSCARHRRSARTGRRPRKASQHYKQPEAQFGSPRHV